MADYSTQIAQLESMLNASTRRVNVDGLSAEIDLASVRKRLAELRALDAEQIRAGRVRPRVTRINLGNCW